MIFRHHSWRSRAALRAAGVVGALLVAATPAWPAPSVRLLEGANDGIAGPASAGRPGDYLLENGEIRVVIGALGHALGVAASGGTILDAAPRGGEDAWGQAHLMLTDDFPRQARYLEEEVLPPGARGSMAGVRFTGRDSRVPDIEIETEYLIGPGDRFVTIRTLYRWPFARTLERGIAGDRIDAGATRPFLPGHGFLAPGEPTGSDSSIAGDALYLAGGDVTYGWVSSSCAGVSPFRGAALRYRLAPFRLGGRSEKRLDRRLYVVKGGPAALLAQLADPPLVPVTGSVRSEGERFPIPSALVEIRDGRGILTVAAVGEEGLFRAALPPGGSYSARAVVAGSRLGRGSPFHGEAGAPVSLDITLPPPGLVRFTIEEGGGALLPGKITIRSRSGRRRERERGLLPPVETVYTRTGSGEIVLPAGAYLLVGSRGITYSIDRSEVAVRSGETTAALFRLARAAGGERRAAVDLNVRTVASLDGPVTLEDRLLEAVAEGLDAIVVADRGRVAPAAAEGWAGGPILLRGEEVEVNGLGRFGAFPLTRAGGLAPRGGEGAEGKAPAWLFRQIRSAAGTPLLQVHAPRDPEVGYLARMGLDPETGLSTNIEFDGRFDLLEVANGRRLDEAPEVLADWFHLLNLGHRIFATGNSDSRTHEIGAAGMPHNEVEIGDSPTAGALVAAIRAGRFYLTTGPSIRFRVHESGRPGDLVAAPDGLVEVAVDAGAPAWIDIDRIRVIGNGAVLLDERPRGGRGRPYRVRETVAVYADTWFVAVVTGSKALDPVYAGPNGEPVLPVAVSNPVWVDFNGNGSFDPPGAR